MKKTLYKLKSEVWVYPGQAGWRFVSIERKTSERIKNDFLGLSRGWGSLPVLAKIGQTSWKTSIFPESKSGEYLLPVKSAVRKSEGVYDKDIIEFTIKIKV